MEYPGCTLHQIGPYLGKTRPYLARQLVSSFSKEGDWIWDPFCGSGTIALEGRLQHRNVIAADINPYACHLTRSKLHAPCRIDNSIAQLESISRQLSKAKINHSGEIPHWVKVFFHSKTLRQTRFIVEKLLRNRNYFLIGCLLGILHHQRPGFLSYPASHLIPYLRTKLFPRRKYPEAYQYRDPIPRLISKVQRVLKFPPVKDASKFRVLQKSIFSEYLNDGCVDTVITSPPYMNNLDYARDNRLRLWFLGVDDYEVIADTEVGNMNSFQEEMLRSLKIISNTLKRKGKCVLILGDVTKNERTFDLPALVSDIVKENIKEFELGDSWSERIPYERRSLRHTRGTKKETVLIFVRR